MVSYVISALYFYVREKKILFSCSSRTLDYIMLKCLMSSVFDDISTYADKSSCAATTRITTQ